jgi:hypothetical protein
VLPATLVRNKSVVTTGRSFVSPYSPCLNNRRWKLACHDASVANPYPFHQNLAAGRVLVRILTAAGTISRYLGPPSWVSKHIRTTSPCPRHIVRQNKAWRHDRINSKFQLQTLLIIFRRATHSCPLHPQYKNTFMRQAVLNGPL